MRILIALHSTTGNTRLVTRFAAERLRAHGHFCEVVDVVKHPDPPDLDGVDLLGIAAPVMYLRPTFTMEGYVARLPNARDDGVPSFILETCGGMPGASMAMLAELLAYKGYPTIGATWVLAPSNWPPHVRAMKKIAATAPLAPLGRLLPREQRWIPALLWEAACHPDEGDRAEVERFVDDVTRRAAAFDPAHVPAPSALHRPIPTTASLGRIIPREFPDLLRFHVVAGRCTACGTCVKVCSEHIITQASDDAVPVIGSYCSGCYACFNHCPEGAIGELLSPPGEGQYRSPPRSMRDLFRDAG